MSTFNVELKKVVDDSYDIEIGFSLEEKLILDLKAGLVGNIKKYVVVTDSVVKDLYGEKIHKLIETAGFKTDLIVFEAGEKSKTRETKEYVEDTMLSKGYRRDCCIIAVGGGVVTDLAGFVAGLDFSISRARSTLILPHGRLFQRDSYPVAWQKP